DPGQGEDAAGEVGTGPVAAVDDGDRDRHAHGDGGRPRSPRLAGAARRLHRTERRQGHRDPPRRSGDYRDHHRSLDRPGVPAERQADGARHPRRRERHESAPGWRAHRRRQGGPLMRAAVRRDKRMATAMLIAAVLLAAAPARRAAGPADPNVVLSREDVAEVKHAARHLGRVTVSGKDGMVVVHVGADGKIGRIGILELRNPARLALDLQGVTGRFGNAAGALLVKGVRIGKTDSGSRVVIDAQGETMPRYQIVRVGSGVDVLVGERSIAQKAGPTPARAEMTAQKGTRVWKFGGPGPVAQATVPAPRAAAMASDARVATQSNVYDTANYNGRKVDFNVKDIDIKNLLGAIAEISKKNIIVAD